MSAFVLFFVTVLAILFTVGVSREKKPDRWRPPVSFLGLAVLVWSRDLLWTVIAMEAYCAACGAPIHRQLRWLSLWLPGLLLMAWFGGGTALVDVGSSSGAAVSLAVLLTALIVRWLSTWDGQSENVFSFAAGAVALVAVVVNAGVWAPDALRVVRPFLSGIALAGILVGGFAAALSNPTPAVARWLVVSQLGLAMLGALSGAPALVHVLLHVAASMVAVSLLPAIRTAAAWILLGSLASLPPFPGFVTKLGLFATLSPGMLAAALAGTFFVGIGCVRQLHPDAAADADADARDPSWRVAAAIVFMIAFAVFGEQIQAVAALATTGLF